MNKTTVHASAHKEPPTSHAKKENVIEKKVKAISKKGGSQEQAEWAMEIYKQCGDVMAVYMVESESGFIVDRVSPKNKNGTRDHLLFQFNSQYHHKFINSKPTPHEQIVYGCNLYKAYKAKGLLAKRWYGYRNITLNPKAMNNVKNRFLITYE